MFPKRKKIALVTFFPEVMPPLFDVFDKSRLRCDLCRRSARLGIMSSLKTRG
jgi:hypothetical protein